jgi:hypothetical protein
MKKTIVLFAFALLSLTHSNAQKNSNRSGNSNEFYFGFKAGTNFSNVYDSKGDDFVADGKFGLVAGGFVSIPLGKHFGIQPEILFSQKGFKSKGKFLGTAYQTTRTSDYLDIPVLFALKPVDNLSILLGPQFSYLLQQKDEFTGGSLSGSQQKDFTNDNFRKNTLSFIGGADANLNNFVLGLRAGWDLKNNHGDGTSSTPRYKNIWYQATLGYKFN